MTPEAWKRLCAAHFRLANIPPEHAKKMAEKCFKLAEEDGGYQEHGPEDAADIEMSYWDF